MTEQDPILTSDHTATETTESPKDTMEEMQAIADALEQELQNEEHPHHHHHHHHHSHSRRKKKKTSKKRWMRFCRFVKKNRTSCIFAALFVLCLSALLIVSFWDILFDTNDILQPTSDQPPVRAKETIQVELPFFSGEETLISDAAVAYLDDDLQHSAADVLSEYREENKRLDTGLPVELSWQISSLPAGYFVESAKVEVSENKDMSDARIFRLNGEQRSLDIYFLKTNTRYHYRITLVLSDDSEHSFQGSFETADTPRILSIDGLVNVRDIGSWKTEDGKVVRQGLLYRGSELDGAVEEDYSLSQTGLLDALTVLGIRTDMDLRSPGDNSDGSHALGANVKHIYYDVLMYEEIFTEEGQESIRKVFSDLADPNLYPVYLHCTYGADRTGTVCFLLEALLGLSKEDLIQEYELTALYHTSVTRNNLNGLFDMLETQEGDTFSEKTASWLHSIGVSDTEIETIRSVFLA